MNSFFSFFNFRYVFSKQLSVDNKTHLWRSCAFCFGSPVDPPSRRNIDAEDWQIELGKAGDQRTVWRPRGAGKAKPKQRVNHADVLGGCVFFIY
jgi:hypothetical protein